jgi:hypothetical protein
VSRETLLRRFDLGHIMLGLYDGEALVGLASFSYRQFSSEAETKAFCETEWSPFYREAIPDRYNTVIIYNAEILPSKRGHHYVHYLLNSMMAYAYNDGCRFLIGIGRIPTYNGDLFNHIRQKPEVKAAIDRYFAGGEYPEQSVFQKDPLLALYAQIGGCRVLTMIKDYVPEDEASGGFRAIVYTELKGQWRDKL